MAADLLAFRVPTTVPEALDDIADGESTVLAGGTSVALLIGQALIEPSKLVLLTRIPALRSLTVDLDARLVRMGAAVTLREIAVHSEIRAAFPALAAAAGAVGNPRVRSVATVGGALAHADPRQDLPPVLLALGAQVTIAGPSGTRTVPLAGFATGFMETTLGPDELIVEVALPLLAGQRSHYARFTPQSMADYPTVGVAAALRWGEDDTILEAAVALGGVGATAIGVDDARLLAGVAASEVHDAIAEVAQRAADVAEPSDDRRGSAAYKRAMVTVWTERALVSCLLPRL